MSWSVRWMPLVLALTVAPVLAQSKTAKLSPQTQGCIACHRGITPGIVSGWLAGRHSQTTPAEGLAKPKLQRRISAATVPASLSGVAVGCYECHSLNAADHQDNFEHFGFKINVIVSPKDCSTCHSVEAEQYSHSKKALALDILEKNPLFMQMVDSTTAGRQVVGHKLVATPGTENAKREACYACHGTRVTVEGKLKVVHDDVEVEVPNLKGWPNNGTGRINPDGSRGSCTACHTRHSFSIAMARQPQTCSTCHMLPDTPAWEAYRESKHGNLYLTFGQKWNWSAVPWKPGTDFEAPTCASCHNSLLVNPEDESQVLAPRTHDFGERLYVRIFGLPYSHPQPTHARTWELRNAEGQPLPTSFDGKPAPTGLIGPAEQLKRKQTLQAVCTSCHSTSFTTKQFAHSEQTYKEADGMVKAATDLLQLTWQHKLADPRNPFDEEQEQRWVEQWLFYANSMRYGSAMMAPDYASFEFGWWNAQKNLQAMGEWLTLRKIIPTPFVLPPKP